MRKPNRKKRTKRTAVAAVTPLAHKIVNAGRLLEVGRSSIYELVRDGDLDLVKIRGCSRITDESIRRLLARGS
jgi:hypothetical protein